MEKITCTVNEACASLSLGRSKLYALIKAGEIDTVKIGTRTLVKVASLLRLVEINSEPTSVPTFQERILAHKRGQERTAYPVKSLT